MSGRILKIGKVITKKANKITLNATDGDITFSSPKSVSITSNEEIQYKSYKAAKEENEEELLVKKVEGPTEVEVGKTYRFKATQFSRKAQPTELQKVRWAYQIDDAEIQYFKNPGKVIGGIVVKDVVIDDDFWDNKTIRVFAFMQSPIQSNSVESILKAKEYIYIVGTENHSASYGNKMMFAAQAVREIVQYKNPFVTLLIFKKGYNKEEIETIERDAKRHNPFVNFKKIDTTKELITHINEGLNRKHSKIEEIKIFSHGLPGRITFGLGEFEVTKMNMVNDEKAEFNKTHVSLLNKKAFSSNAKIYSYACRTGINSEKLSFEIDGLTPKDYNNPGYIVIYYQSLKEQSVTKKWFAAREEAVAFYNDLNKWTERALQIVPYTSLLELVDTKNSLAQKLADHLDISVYAFLKKTNYVPTWGDTMKNTEMNNEDRKKYKGAYEKIEDETVNGQWYDPRDYSDWDKVLWNPNGAYLPPNGGELPKGLPRNMFEYKKDTTPKAL